MEFHPFILAVFFLYFASLIAISVVRVRPMREMSDYVLGGRRMSSFTSALSASSSTTSGWTMLVFPALAFSEGAVHLWTALGIVLGVWFVWTVLGKRLRRYTILEDSLTLPEFLEKRFADRTGILRALTAALTIFFIMIYIDSGLIAGAKLLETVFGIDWTPGVLVTLVAVTSYTFIGGFLAVSRTDVFQAMLMLAGFFVLPLALIAMTSDPFQGQGQDSDFWNPLTAAGGQGITFAFILSTSGWGLGAFGSQRILQRLMAVGGEGKIRPSRNIGTTWVFFIFGLAFLVGLVAKPALAEAGIAVSDPEGVYIVLADAFFTPVVTGLLLTGVIAAVMSTADSQLLLASAIATADLPVVKRFAYRMRYEYAAVGMLFYRTGGPDWTPSTGGWVLDAPTGDWRGFTLGAYGRVWLGRLLLVMTGAAAAALALLFPNSIFDLVAYAWGGMGATFGPATILALYWSRFNFTGALASILTGAATVTFWQFMSGGPWGIFDMGIAAAPGFLAGTIAAVVGTLLTSEPPEQVAENFDRVNPARRGVPVVHSGIEVTVLDAKRGYPAEDGSHELREGYEWVTATLRVRNVGGKPDEPDPYHDVEFPLIGERGVTYDDIFVPPHDERRLGSGKLVGGEEVIGDVVREVHKEDDNLMLIYSPTFGRARYLSLEE